jgi:osmotically inducible protein OsmC
MNNSAQAFWNGNGIDGYGRVSSQSAYLNELPYTYRNDRLAKGTNPSELIAAAHASCFAIKLAFVLEAEGYVPTRLITHCELLQESNCITEASLSVKAEIPGIPLELFHDLVTHSGKSCPVSLLLKIPIHISVDLNTGSAV